MSKYQLLFIIDNDLGDEAKDAVVEKFKQQIEALGGSIIATEKWGTRKLAYAINKKTSGYYVLVVFEAGADVPAEIERQMRINDDIVRQMITKA